MANPFRRKKEPSSAESDEGATVTDRNLVRLEDGDVVTIFTMSDGTHAVMGVNYTAVQAELEERRRVQGEEEAAIYAEESVAELKERVERGPDYDEIDATIVEVWNNRDHWLVERGENPPTPSTCLPTLTLRLEGLAPGS